MGDQPYQYEKSDTSNKSSFDHSIQENIRTCWFDTPEFAEWSAKLSYEIIANTQNWCLVVTPVFFLKDHSRECAKNLKMSNLIWHDFSWFCSDICKQNNSVSKYLILKDFLCKNASLACYKKTFYALLFLTLLKRSQHRTGFKNFLFLPF